VDAGGLWGDEQRLADLLVSPAGSHFAETLAYYSQAQAMRQARAPGQSLRACGSGQRPASEKRQLLVLARRRYLGR
jgi:hypothetical protein